MRISGPILEIAGVFSRGSLNFRPEPVYRNFQHGRRIRVHLHKVQHQPRPGLRSDPANPETNQQLAALLPGPYVFRSGKRAGNFPAVVRADLADRSDARITLRKIRIRNIMQSKFPAETILLPKPPHNVVLRKSGRQAAGQQQDAQ